jgi:hypothetical protein
MLLPCLQGRWTWLTIELAVYLKYKSNWTCLRVFAAVQLLRANGFVKSQWISEPRLVKPEPEFIL